jgi:regulator of protease activity HflC (stomatin/prohibitin superfamily)
LPPVPIQQKKEKTLTKFFKGLGFPGSLIVIAILLIGFLTVAYLAVTPSRIKGNQIGVLETWWGGVHEEPRGPGMHFLFPGIAMDLKSYSLQPRVFVMNDIPGDVEESKGRELDSYEVQSREGQTMNISFSVRWKINPDQIIQLHKEFRSDGITENDLIIEERLIRPQSMRIIKDAATRREAIDAYSGEGLVSLQAEIQSELSSKEGELYNSGIIVENFVIEGIKLDPEYIGEIRARQVATQKELRAKEEERAALAEAQKANAEAQADYERAVVEAERDKAVGILRAEQDQQKQVLAAEALKEKLVLEATGQKEADLLKAQGILALGQAEAEAKKLQLEAFAVEGADAFVQVEVAKAMAEAFKNIDGYLPEDMKINLLSQSFMDSIKSIVNPQASNTEESK